jgi:hypothetical protein
LITLAANIFFIRWGESELAPGTAFDARPHACPDFLTIVQRELQRQVEGGMDLLESLSGGQLAVLFWFSVFHQ